MSKKIIICFLGIFLVNSLHNHQQTNKQCDSKANQYYDEIDKICKKCPPGSPIYNIQYKMCQCCPGNLTWNQQTAKCICPANKPIFNNIKNTCSACPKGLEYDKTQNQCFHCPEGFIRGDEHTCIPMYQS